MRKLRIYIDTSVIGGCLDAEFQDASRALLEMAEQGVIVLLVSDLVVFELLRAPDEVGAILKKMNEEAFEAVETGFESERLRNLYLNEGVVGPRHINDAHHVAIATVERANMIVSWNFKHLVHYERIRGFNAVNLKEGYPRIEIYSPREVV